MNPLNIMVLVLFPTAVLLIVVGLGKRAEISKKQKIARKKIRGKDEKTIIPGIGLIEGFLERFGLSERLNTIMSGAYLNFPPAVFVLAFLGVFSLVFFVLWAYLKLSLFVNILFSLSMTTLSAWMYVNNRKNHYTDEMVKQLPHVAVILSNSLKAGLTVSQAIKLVVKRSSWPANAEFGKVSQEISLGYSVEESLQRMAKRIQIKEITTIVVTIQVLRKSGGNLSQALAIMANAIMGRERVRAEVRVLTSEARYTSLALLILPFVILIMLNTTQSGTVTRFLNKPFGVVIMVLFLAVQFAAFVMINRFAKIDV